MPEEKQEKLPLDAKLLSDAVIELNISRRSVGMYPPEHPIVRTSIERAFEHLQKLFEIRVEITLGIAKDVLIVDEYTLDRKNPVFREFAQTLHAKGIAAVTFSLGLNQTELKRLHELISAKDSLLGKELVELAEKEISHIRLSPIDFGNFCFVEGAQRSGTACGDVWEDYVYGLLEGKLGDGGGIQGILSIPPETVADVVNAALPEEASNESYERVITAYIKKKSASKISREAFAKFFSFMDRLKPEIKRQFLSRAGSRLTEDIGDVEAIINGMTPEAFEKIAELLTENSSIIPTTLKNLIDKLSSIKKGKMGHFDFSITIPRSSMILSLAMKCSSSSGRIISMPMWGWNIRESLSACLGSRQTIIPGSSASGRNAKRRPLTKKLSIFCLNSWMRTI